MFLDPLHHLSVIAVEVDARILGDASWPFPDDNFGMKWHLRSTLRRTRWISESVTGVLIILTTAPRIHVVLGNMHFKFIESLHENV